MKVKETGGSAFPTSPNDSDPTWAAARAGGITMRDYFAAKAIPAWTSLVAERGLSEEAIKALGLTEESSNAQATAKYCYMIADAMILERKGE